LVPGLTKHNASLARIGYDVNAFCHPVICARLVAGSSSGCVEVFLSYWANGTHAPREGTRRSAPIRHHQSSKIDLAQILPAFSHQVYPNGMRRVVAWAEAAGQMREVVLLTNNWE